MDETEKAAESSPRAKVGTHATLHATGKKTIFKPGAELKYDVFHVTWPEEKGEVTAAEGVAEEENPLSYADFEGTLKVSISSLGVQYDYSNRDLTPADSIREMAQQLEEDHSLWVKLLQDTDSPLEKLLVDHDVGKVEFEAFEEGGFEYNSISGDWSLKLGVFTVKFVDLQGELKLEFALAKKDGNKKSFGAITVGGAFKPFTAPDFKFVDGVLIKGPAIEVAVELEASPKWTRIARRVLEEAKDLLPEVLEALASDSALAAGEAVLAAAAIYLAYKTIDRLAEDAKAIDDINKLTSYLPAVKDEICRGFIEGVQKSVREHPQPGNSPHGLGMQLGAVAKHGIGTRLRKEHAKGLLVEKAEFDFHFDDYVVRKTSDPQVQQDLLDKCKKSGKIDSIARCVVFAAWADHHSGQQTSIKRAAWETLFQRWQNDGDKTLFVERRTLLRAIGPRAYRDNYGTPPSDTQVGEVSL